MSKIKIKATERMANLLNNYIKESKNYCIDTIKIQKFRDERAYGWYVGDVWDNEADYNYIDGSYKAIRVIYKYENYATDKYITTKELNDIFIKLKDKTLNNFLSAVIDNCLI